MAGNFALRGNDSDPTPKIQQSLHPPLGNPAASYHNYPFFLKGDEKRKIFFGSGKGSGGPLGKQLSEDFLHGVAGFLWFFWAADYNYLSAGLLGGPAFFFQPSWSAGILGYQPFRLNLLKQSQIKSFAKRALHPDQMFAGKAQFLALLQHRRRRQNPGK